MRLLSTSMELKNQFLRLNQTAIKIALAALSFLIRKELLKEDQAFAVLQVLPISDTTITTLLSGEKTPACTATRNTAVDYYRYRTNY